MLIPSILRQTQHPLRLKLRSRRPSIRIHIPYLIRPRSTSHGLRPYPIPYLLIRAPLHTLIYRNRTLPTLVRPLQKLNLVHHIIKKLPTPTIPLPPIPVRQPISHLKRTIPNLLQPLPPTHQAPHAPSASSPPPTHPHSSQPPHPSSPPTSQPLAVQIHLHHPSLHHSPPHPTYFQISSSPTYPISSPALPPPPHPHA